MPRKYTLTASSLGVDTDIVDIYHTSVTAGNLITSSISASSLLTGVDLIVDDSATTFIVVNASSPCSGSSGSVTSTVYSPSTRFFDLIVADTNESATSSGTGSVSIISPVAAGPSSTTLSQTVDFDSYSTFTAAASPATDYEFTGWYTSSLTSSGALISTNTTLNITENAYTHSLREDNFYAVFSYSPAIPESGITASLQAAAVLPTWLVAYKPSGSAAPKSIFLGHSEVFSFDFLTTSPSYVDITVQKTSNGGVAEDAGSIDIYVDGSGSVDQINFSFGDSPLVNNKRYDLSGQQPGAQIHVDIYEG